MGLIGLGIILAIVGAVVPMLSVLITIGIILVVAGVVLIVIPGVPGRPAGRRGSWYW